MRQFKIKVKSLFSLGLVLSINLSFGNDFLPGQAENSPRLLFEDLSVADTLVEPNEINQVDKDRDALENETFLQ